MGTEAVGGGTKAHSDPGVGGAGIIGDVLITGFTGGAGKYDNLFGSGGYGGKGGDGANTTGTGATYTGSPANYGQDGLPYGGGGTGTRDQEGVSGATYKNGGAGASGGVIITIIAPGCTTNSPTAISSSAGNTICAGTSTTLTATGGGVSPYAVDVWYAGGCNEAYINRWSTAPSSVTNTTVNNVNNGILNVTSTNGDPMIHMYSPALGSFDPNVYKYINVRYRITAGTAGDCQIFFTNSTYPSPTGPVDVVNSPLVSDNNWHIVSIDMTTNPNWTTGGNITGWRFDWATASGVTADIDFIQLSAYPMVGEGSTLSVSPTTTSTYYTTRIYNCSATTACISKTITVNPLPTVVPSISFTPNANVCIGTNVTYTATPSSQNAYAWIFPGTALSNYVLVSNGTSTDNKAVVAWMNNAAGTQIKVNYQDANGCWYAGAPATSSTISLPSPVASLSSNGESATCVINGNNPIHFYNMTSNNYIGSINPNGRAGIVTMTSYVPVFNTMTPGSTDGTLYACGNPGNEAYRTAYLGRNFTIIPTGAISGSVQMNVFFPFTTAEFSDLQTRATNYTLGNTFDTPSAVSDLYVTRYHNPGSEDGSANNNCTPAGASTVVFNSGNGTTLSDISLYYSVIPAVANADFAMFQVPDFSEFYLHGQDMAVTTPLPIDLISFSGECNADGVQLKWQTATETNVNHFEVLRSRDGQAWQNIEAVTAVGNSSVVNSYGYNDMQGSDVFYYRLRSIDNDGRINEYTPISVKCNNINLDWHIQPVPVNSKATILINSDHYFSGTIYISDVSGRNVFQQQVSVNAGSNSYELDLQDLQNGAYFVSILGTNGFKPLRIIKAN